MYKVKLTTVSSDPIVSQKSVIVGTTTRLPTVGREFKTKYFRDGEFCTHATSAVKHVERIDKEYRFRTKSFSYILEILDDDGDESLLPPPKTSESVQLAQAV